MTTMVLQHVRGKLLLFLHFFSLHFSGLGLSVVDPYVRSSVILP